MSDSIKLKPCPHCGPGNSMVSPWHDDVARRWRIGCGRCGSASGVHPYDLSPKAAAISWNTRDGTIGAEWVPGPQVVDAVYLSAHPEVRRRQIAFMQANDVTIEGLTD